jgi:hypothetical protein
MLLRLCRDYRERRRRVTFWEMVSDDIIESVKIHKLREGTKFNNPTGLGDVNRTSRFRSIDWASQRVVVLSLLILHPRGGR